MKMKMVCDPACDPVGGQEIMARLGLVGGNTVRTWVRLHHTFPRPRWTVSGRPAWHWPDIQGWLRATGRPSEPVMVEIYSGPSMVAIGAEWGTLPLASLEGSRPLLRWLEKQGWGEDPDLWVAVAPADTQNPTAERVAVAAMTAAVTPVELAAIRAAMDETEN